MMSRTPFAVAALLAATMAEAHAPKVGHNGGPQANAGSYHLEIVPKGTTLTVYLRSHSDRPVATAGFKGSARFTLDGQTESISLLPAGDNTLVGTATRNLPAEPKGLVEVSPPGGAAAQAKF